jgi:hypothetical protein
MTNLSRTIHPWGSRSKPHHRTKVKRMIAHKRTMRHKNMPEIIHLPIHSSFRVVQTIDLTTGDTRPRHMRQPNLYIIPHSTKNQIPSLAVIELNLQAPLECLLLYLDGARHPWVPTTQQNRREGNRTRYHVYKPTRCMCASHINIYHINIFEKICNNHGLFYPLL